MIAVLILLILGSAYLSGSETALFSLTRMQRKSLSEGSDAKGQMAAKLLESPRDLLITLIMVNVILGILVQNVVSSIFGTMSGWLLNVLVPLALILVFGEFIPKSISIANNEMVAKFVAKPLFAMQKALLPVRRFLIWITSPISRVVFFYLKDEKEISSDELQHALRSSKARGVLAEDESELMRGYLNLQESTAKGFMRPREEVLFFELSEPLDKLIHLFVDQECTRIPICDGELDKIVGVMTSGRFFLHRESLQTTQDLLPILNKPFFVPESTSAKALLDQMYENRQSLAIVVDEYGAFAGLITLEDLVETVVGEIVDRRDEQGRYTRSGEDVIIASGKLEVMELETLFETSLKSDHNMVTIGGWLTEKLGDIPKNGTKHRHKNLLFHILSADSKRVKRIYIRRIDEK